MMQNLHGVSKTETTYRESTILLIGGDKEVLLLPEQAPHGIQTPHHHCSMQYSECQAREIPILSCAVAAG